LAANMNMRWGVIVGVHDEAKPIGTVDSHHLL
jgi:hypothetical protein